MQAVTALLAGIALALAILVPTVLLSPSLSRWAWKQKYRYEVTFALYMLTPTERFIFNSFVFLTLSMVLIAGSLYLPEHVMTISNRAFYYWSGYTQGAASPRSPQTSALACASISQRLKASSLLGLATESLLSTLSTMSCGVPEPSAGAHAALSSMASIADSVLPSPGPAVA